MNLTIAQPSVPVKPALIDPAHAPFYCSTMKTPGKPNLHSPCRTLRQWTRGLALGFLLNLTLTPRVVIAQATANPPERLAYQGYVTDGTGVALATSSPKNYDIVFRIWNDPSASAPNNRLWSELQTVTVDKGYFSVLLGEGGQYSGEAHPNLSSVFAGTDASDRYVEFTVRGIGTSGSDVTILPRLKLLSSPYAFLAKNAASLISPNGESLATAENGQLTVNGTITGNASGLTNLSAGQLTSGTLPNGRLGGTYANALTLNNAANSFSGTFSGTFSGNGSSLTSLSAANLTGSVPTASLTSVPAGSLTGSIDDARLSGNVAKLNANNSFTGNNNFSGNVGINTSTPGAALDVNGTIRATSFDAPILNGEKKPYVVDINFPNDTQLYHAVEVPSNIIESYLGDANGGTIRFLLRVNSSDEVRVIDEMIYMEQPGKTANATTGTSGMTYQAGGATSSYILGNGIAYDLCPAPWSWIWMRNYNTRGLAGLPGSNSAPFSGADKYKVEFLTPPNISATIIIYDR